MDAFLAYMSIQRVQKRASNPLELSYRQLWATMWLLGIEPGSPGRAASALNYDQAISPVPIKQILGTEEMAQWLRAAVLSTQIQSIHSTHMVAHSCL